MPPPASAVPPAAPTDSAPSSALLLVTLQLSGYSADTFGANESTLFCVGLSAALGVPTAAVTVVGIHDAAAGNETTRRLLAAAERVLVDVQLNAAMAGVNVSSLATSLASISPAAMCAALQSAGLSRLIGAALSKITAWPLPLLARSPPPPPEPVSPPDASAAPAPRTAVQVLALNSYWGTWMLVTAIPAWAFGLFIGLLLRRPIQNRLARKRGAPKKNGSQRMPRMRLFSGDDADTERSGSTRSGDFQASSRRATLLGIEQAEQYAVLSPANETT